MLRNPFRNLDHKKLSRSSDVLKAQNDYFKIVNRRIFVFSIIITVCFAMIVVRLGYLQLIAQEDYARKLENYSSNTEKDASSRGQILDRNNQAVAKTVSSHNIVYFPPQDVSSEEQWGLAQKFAKRFEVSIDAMTNSDYQDLYMFLHTDKNGEKDGGKNLLKEEELNYSADEKEKLIRNRITKEMVDELADENTKKAFVVYLAMRKLPDTQTKVVIEDANENDVAYLTENKEEFPGFNVDLSSWKREYPYGDTLRDVLGSVTTSKQGIPSELRAYYEAKGYALTSRVGKSGLEQQYEELLAGTPRVSEIAYDEDGIALLTPISSGKKGYDLHMSIDIDLQQRVDAILNQTLETYAGTAGREKFNKLSVILMNPMTGEIYAMSGKYKDEAGKIQNFSSAAYLDSYASGSVVKGATVYMLLEEGAESKTSIEIDAPMRIANDKERSSYQNYGPVDAVKALQVSSNVYMWKGVLKMAGTTYQEGQPLNISNERQEEMLHTMRNYYSMFGLGTKTLLDVPNEAVGFKGFLSQGGQLLDYSIGQFDNYTPIHLAQYVSMIANGGKRIQPKLVNYATEINSDYRVMENKTNVLSAISTPQEKENLKTVQEGFRSCVTDGHCGLRNFSVPVAAKTGTAQVPPYTNASLVGYAPYGDNPKVAFVCSAPTSAADSFSQEVNICSSTVMPQVLTEFFKKY